MHRRRGTFHLSFGCKCCYVLYESHISRESQHDFQFTFTFTTQGQKSTPCLGLLLIACTATALNHFNNIAGLFVDVSTVNNTHTTTSRTVAFGVFPARRARLSPFMFTAQLSFLTELLSLFHTLPVSGEPMCLRICLAVL